MKFEHHDPLVVEAGALGIATRGMNQTVVHYILVGLTIIAQLEYPSALFLSCSNLPDSVQSNFHRYCPICGEGREVQGHRWGSRSWGCRGRCWWILLSGLSSPRGRGEKGLILWTRGRFGHLALWQFSFQLPFKKAGIKANCQFLEESQGSWFPDGGNLVLDLLFQSSIKLVAESGIIPTQILTFGLKLGRVVSD